ncbi:MAG: helix-turn-helix domain-containing protein [Candidatus Eisenbacteria bacterium]|nr:helix-turn-helix domain-containing protein [Candidatus Eisenbacteria bacterium]
MAVEREILTAEQVADYLRLSRKSVYRLARAGVLPAKKIMNQWRFERSQLNEWMREKENEPVNV